MRQYRELVTRICSQGTTKPNRTGEDTISLFHHSYVIDLREGFPLLTGKKIHFRNVLFEMLWFLGGDNRVDWLHKHNIHFWDQWIENEKYLPEAYGKFWRDYPDTETISNDIGYRESPSPRLGFDQFEAIINELKTNPNSRRMVLTNWYPPSAWRAKLPPCHLMCIFNVQYDESGEPYLNLEMLQRSCDVPVGVPFNIASYAFFLELVGNLVSLPVRYFAHTLVDAHIYKNQLKGIIEYQKRELRPLPKFKIREQLNLRGLDELIRKGSTEEIERIFVVEDYNPHPFIKFPVMV